MKDEQDAAYQASLAADKLKAEQRALEKKEEQEQLLEKERKAQKELQDKAKQEVRTRYRTSLGLLCHESLM